MKKWLLQNNSSSSLPNGNSNASNCNNYNNHSFVCVCTTACVWIESNSSNNGIANTAGLQHDWHSDKLIGRLFASTNFFCSLFIANSKVVNYIFDTKIANCHYMSNVCHAIHTFGFYMHWRHVLTLIIYTCI